MALILLAAMAAAARGAAEERREALGRGAEVRGAQTGQDNESGAGEHARERVYTVVLDAGHGGGRMWQPGKEERHGAERAL